jgi:hypothetical protein
MPETGRVHRRRVSHRATAVWLQLLVVAVMLGPSCRNSPDLPTPPSLPALQAGLSGTGFRLAGQVIDAESEAPIPGATVVPVEFSTASKGFHVTRPVSTIADQNGMFALMQPLPGDWTTVVLRATRSGYEPANVFVANGSATAARLQVYRALTIHAGESIDLRVFLGHYACGWESWHCRRFVVEAEPGELVDLELTMIDPPGGAGLVVGEPPPSNTPYLARNLTVSAGEAWVIGGGRLTLTAWRH